MFMYHNDNKCIQLFFHVYSIKKTKDHSKFLTFVKSFNVPKVQYNFTKSKISVNAGN